ncbi:hypothetical protein E3983_09990 [Legionella israelensis]|uniref:Uncharacterized protein n=1 Tax=Legionella israelensis TaxID=454 RepID=A0AAX1EHV4_9GAMM|nr:hypothetical protein [Legionella israelensis]QBR84663.1 hypothetical protein E3983_09990 [Legionella israelensis]
MSNAILLPRIIRLRDAPAYLGMDRHRFNEEVRPNVRELSIGTQGIAFDRLDLDAWVDDYIQCSDRPAASNRRSLEIWDESARQESTKKVVTGKSTKNSLDTDFAKALVLATSKKRKNT